MLWVVGVVWKSYWQVILSIITPFMFFIIWRSHFRFICLKMAVWSSLTNRLFIIPLRIWKFWHWKVYPKNWFDRIDYSRDLIVATTDNYQLILFGYSKESGNLVPVVKTTLREEEVTGDFVSVDDNGRFILIGTSIRCLSTRFPQELILHLQYYIWWKSNINAVRSPSVQISHFLRYDYLFCKW